MALPKAPPITAEDIRTAFNGPQPFNLFDYYAGGKYVPAGTKGVPSSGPISFYDFLGGETTSSGQWERLTAGVYQFEVPAYAKMTVEMSGGSGGSGSSAWDNQPANVVGSGNRGREGSETFFLGMVAGAGDGGQGCVGGGRYNGTVPGKAQAGNASGGQVNTLGGGVKGAVAGQLFFGNPTSAGGEGGDAGYCKREYELGGPGSPVVGQTITVTVGAGGAPGPALGNPGLRGSDGYVKIKWK